MAIKVQVLSLDASGNAAPQSFMFDKDIVLLGREKDCDITLEGEEVSGQHARICLKGTGQGAGLFITDVGSTNGTAVNSSIISKNSEVTISLHDRIIIGKFLIKAEVVTKQQSQTETATKKPQQETKSVSSQEAIVVPPPPPPQAQVAVKTPQADSAEPKAAPRSAQTPERAQASTKTSKTTNDLGRGRMRRRRFKRKTTQTKRSPQAANNSNEVKADGPVHGIFVTISGTVGHNDVDNVDFSALRLLSISGVVLHKGNPLPGVLIDGGELGEEITDEQGRFEFEDISEHTSYNLTPSKDKFIFDGDALSGDLDDDVELTLHATELFTISGKIEHNGKALVGVILDGGPLGEAVTNSKGEYFFYNVPEGTSFEITPKMDGFKINDTGDENDEEDEASEDESDDDKPIELGM